MCGRYAIIEGKKIFATFAMLREMERQITPSLSQPRYNAAPTEKLPIIFQSENGTVIRDAVWWLIPHWSISGKPDMRFASFNARSDTIDKSKLYGVYFKSRRCLVPADGFFEWMRTEKPKQPMFIRMKDKKPFMMAGVYSVWKSPTGEEQPSFSIITTTPNELVSPIHNRMPVILDEGKFEPWLDRSNNDTEKLKSLLSPFPADAMETYPVTPRMSNSRYAEPDCVIPLAEKE
jgi:putative SOS response-associated peptidase YedK